MNKAIEEEILELNKTIVRKDKEKQNLIKYLEDMIDWTTEKANLPEKYIDCTTNYQSEMWWVVQTRKEILSKIKEGNYEN